MAKSSSSCSTDIVFGDGGLLWGYENQPAVSPDQKIQASFIDEMSHVSSEVREVLETLKLREKELREQENLANKRQLKLDIKQKDLNSLQRKVGEDLMKLENGAFDTVVALQNSIADLRKENQRLKESFGSLSKSHATLKSDIDMVQSKNSKLEKQLSSANGRIRNLIKLQNTKIKEMSEPKESVNSPPRKKKGPAKPKPLAQMQKELSPNPELMSILMRALSTLDQDLFTSLFEETLQHQYTTFLSALTCYLKQVTSSSAVIQYPVLKLAYKCVAMLSDSDFNIPTVKVISRKLAEVLSADSQYSNSSHLHSRLLSCLILSRTSLQRETLLKSLKQIVADVQEEGAPDILIDNSGHNVLLSSLSDPIQVTLILNILVLLTLSPGPSDPILPELVNHLDRLIELLEEGNSQIITSVTILLQRLSTHHSAKYRIKQNAPLLRRLISEYSCTNSLIVLNCKAVLMNVDCGGMSYYDFNAESVAIKDQNIEIEQPISDKVLKYEEFVNEVLKNDLKHVLEERDKVYDEISEYSKLQTTLERLATIEKRPIRKMIDVGCNFYMQAEVKNMDYFYVDVGMGLHVQLTRDEALKFLSRKIDQLTVKSEHLTDKSVDIKARIKLIIGALGELQGVS